jgi:hypothetical protein
VGGIEQFGNRQAAHRAPALVCVEYRRTKERLMETSLDESRVVPPRDLDDARLCADALGVPIRWASDDRQRWRFAIQLRCLLAAVRAAFALRLSGR